MGVGVGSRGICRGGGGNCPGTVPYIHNQQTFVLFKKNYDQRMH